MKRGRTVDLTDGPREDNDEDALPAPSDKAEGKYRPDVSGSERG